MTYGLDIYRYQTVRDWVKVKEVAGAEFIIVKLTDGTGPAIVRGDAQVSGSQAVGIPVGGYHFAQKGDPIRQANAFKAELNRLRNRFGPWGVIPALDLENSAGIGLHWTGTEARNFAIPFCREMLKDYPRVLLYANTSELRGMDAARICNEVPGVYIWEANYGNNDGTNHGTPRSAWDSRRAAHQYTSNKQVPGIDGRCDANDGNLGILLMNGDDDVSAKDVMEWKIPVRVDEGEEPKPPADFQTITMHNNYAIWKTKTAAEAALASVEELKTRKVTLALSDEDKADIVKELRSTLVGALADELDARARDNNPNTGPVQNT